MGRVLSFNTSSTWICFLLIAAFAVRGSPLFAANSPAITTATEARALASEGQYERAIEKSTLAQSLAHEEFAANDPIHAFIADDIATFYFKQGQYEPALKSSDRAIELSVHSMPEGSTNKSILLATKSVILSNLGRYERALPVGEQAHSGLLQNLGPKHPRAVRQARNLASIYLELSKTKESIDLLTKTITHFQPGTVKEISKADLYLDLSSAYLKDNNFSASRKAVEHAAEGYKNGSEANKARLSLANARIDVQQSKLQSGEKHIASGLQKLDTIYEKNGLLYGQLLFTRSNIQSLRGKAVEAEKTLKKTLEIYTRAVGSQHPAIARVLHNLALIYKKLGLLEQSNRFFEQSISISESNTGGLNIGATLSRIDQSLVLSEIGRHQQAIETSTTAFSTAQSFPPEWDIKRAYSLSAMGFAHFGAGNYDIAEKHFINATNLMAKTRGKKSSDLPPGYMKLGEIYLSRGQHSKAKKYLKTALKIQEKDNALGPRGVTQSKHLMSKVFYAEGNSSKAVKTSREAVESLAERLNVVQNAASGNALGEQKKWREVYETFLNYGLNAVDSGSSATDSAELFRVAQYPHLSDTAAAIERMASRFVPSDSGLANLVRQRQDTLMNWRALDKQLTEKLTTSKIDKKEVDRLKRELKSLEKDLERLDAQLRSNISFERYQDLVNPSPVNWKTVQALLADDEALLLQVTSDSSTFLFLVSSDGVRAARTSLNKDELASAVEALRSSVSISPESGRRTRFNPTTAHKLYENLFGAFPDQLKMLSGAPEQPIKHLFFVPDRAMQNLPPSLLLASAPKQGQQLPDYDYLARHLAVSVLPSVSSLKTLRAQASKKTVRKPMIGFAAPDFAGDSLNDQTSRGLVRKLAKEMPTEVKPERLRQAMPPLPESADEVRAIAASLKASNSDLYFGSKASETTVKSLNLSDYKILAFATHALMTGEFDGIYEPSLALTPPRQASPLDDGLLMASEVAGLKLNADWVILSACNTASPEGKPGAEGLSGLAKAFFYAGSRALLVSHWWVVSQTTTELTTSTFEKLAGNPGMRRAEALRLAMVDMINQRHLADPVYWAPFTVVGEGGAI